MISKRKRDEEDPKKSNIKSEALPLATQQLTNYHVNQLQESNKFYRKKVEELENKISEIVKIFDDTGDDNNNQESLNNLKIIIKKKDDEILGLQNENKRLVMQSILKDSQQPDNMNMNFKGSNKQNGLPDDFDNTNVNLINIRENDLISKLKIKEGLIDDLNEKYDQIFKENLCLKRDLAIFAPCRENVIQNIEHNLNEKDNIDEIKICKCVNMFSEEISILKNQLEAEKRKVINLINSELLKKIKDFLQNHRNCEEHTNSISNELFELRNKYNMLRVNFVSLENRYKSMEIKERDQRKKIRELEFINSKIKDNQLRITEVIKKIDNLFKDGNKDEIVENLMNEYEELSSAFEEKSIECDNLNQKLKEVEQKLQEYNVGIEDVRKLINELDTVKLLYDQKLSLIRKNNKSESLRDLSASSDNSNNSNLSNYSNMANLLKNYLSIDQITNNSEDFVSTNKNLVQFKALSRNLKNEVEFYKEQCEQLKNQVKILQSNDYANSETISILKNRVQYILNKVSKLTNLKIRIDEREENEHLQIDDYDKEINNLKSENQQLLTLMKCSVCCDKLKDTVINRCGHLFCRECIDSNLSSRNRKCPLCHTTFDKNDTNKIFLD